MSSVTMSMLQVTMATSVLFLLEVVAITTTLRLACVQYLNVALVQQSRISWRSIL